MKIFYFLCLVGLARPIFSQVPPIYNETCETNKYPPDQNTIAPTYIVNLDLPPETRWTPITVKYAEPLRNMVNYIKQFIVGISPKFQKLVQIIDNDLGKLADTLPYGSEMKAIAKDSNMPLGDIVLYNIFYEIFTLCTSIVGQDKNGNVYHARNLDFGLLLGWDVNNDTWIISELLRPLIMNVEFVKGGALQYKTVSFIGFVGLITGIRPNVVSISINERFDAKGGYIGLFEWILNINRNQSWVTLVARDVLEKQYNYETALKVLTDSPLIAPCYYIIAGPEPNQGAVITRDRTASVDVWKMGSNNTWFLAETNYDHWKAPLVIDDRITPANRCMNQFGQDKLSFASLFNVLSSKPVLNKLTVYSALMELKTGKVETYIQYCGDPCWPF